MLIDEPVQGLLCDTEAVGILGIDDEHDGITVLLHHAPSLPGVAFA